MVLVSVGWFSQIVFGPSPGKSLRIVLDLVRPLMEPFRQNVLDSMNPHGNIRGRQTRDLAD
jgi:hypothetical protein